MRKKLLKIACVVIWMIGIFYYSSQPAVLSDQNSREIVYLIKTIGIDLNSFFGELANFFVRKAAHFTEYFILCILLFHATREFSTERKSMCISLLLVLMYACTDEFHQLFVPGREGRIKDVLIDTSGGGIAMIVLYLKRKIKKGFGIIK